MLLLASTTNRPQSPRLTFVSDTIEKRSRILRHDGWGRVTFNTKSAVFRRRTTEKSDAFTVIISDTRGSSDMKYGVYYICQDGYALPLTAGSTFSHANRPTLPGRRKYRIPPPSRYALNVRAQRVKKMSCKIQTRFSRKRRFSVSLLVPDLAGRVPEVLRVTRMRALRVFRPKIHIIDVIAFVNSWESKKKKINKPVRYILLERVKNL